jgi:hypothetical protein
MMMRKFWTAVLSIGVLAVAGHARYDESLRTVEPEPGRDGHSGSLDIQCTIDYLGFQYTTSGGAGGPGSIQFTGGLYGGNYGAFKFLNSCAPAETLLAYCIDIHDPLQQAPYCVNIDKPLVDPLYPEQYKAMAYILSWYPVNNALSDDIMQLSMWKLSPKDSGAAGPGNPTFGKPYYRINAGRGYPNLGDPPHAPFVNTIYQYNASGDLTRNTAANGLIIDALGAATGGDVNPSFSSAKNVIFCDDDVVADVGLPSVHNGISTVPVTLHLTRGDSAAAVNNLTKGGVKFLLTTDIGTLSATQVFTDGTGAATFSISQAYGTTTPSLIQVCSRGGWPKIIRQCNAGAQHQTMVQKLTTADLCQLCISVPVLPDQFLDVELASFAARAGDNAVSLQWATSSEQNNVSFKLSRDGHMVRVVAADNLPAGSRYAWTDLNVLNGRTYHYTLSAVDGSGAEAELSTANATPQHQAGVTADFSLAQNFPNPFNPETEIAFSLPELADVHLSVFDLTGREIAVLVNGETAAGPHTVRYDASALPSGMYFYKLTTPGFSATKKMMLMK